MNKSLSVLLALIFCFGCSDSDSTPKINSPLSEKIAEDVVNEKVAQAFVKYQKSKKQGEIKEGTIMCVTELVLAGYLEKEDQRDADEVVKLGEDRTVEIYKGGCKKLLSANSN